jgi:hypothetical protein
LEAARAAHDRNEHVLRHVLGHRRCAGHVRGEAVHVGAPPPEQLGKRRRIPAGDARKQCFVPDGVKRRIRGDASTRYDALPLHSVRKDEKFPRMLRARPDHRRPRIVQVLGRPAAPKEPLMTTVRRRVLGCALVLLISAPSASSVPAQRDETPDRGGDAGYGQGGRQLPAHEIADGQHHEAHAPPDSAGAPVTRTWPSSMRTVRAARVATTASCAAPTGKAARLRSRTSRDYGDVSP